VGSILTAVAGFAKAHPMITKFVMIFTALSAGLLIVVGGLMAVAGGLLVMTSFAPVMGAVVAWILGVGTAIAAVIAVWATWGDHIKAFFVGIGRWIEAIDWKGTGIRIITAIAEGIWAAAGLPEKAIEAVAHKLRSYLPFSPAKTGPLRDLNRVRIIETIAETMRPAPMLAAMKRAAMVTALAAPMMIGAGAPAMAAGRPGGAQINITVHYHISEGSPEEFTRAAEKHADKLLDIINERIGVRRRRDFD
jgi:hypothetical protein